MDAATTLRAARGQAHLSQRDLARRARTSQSAVASYESGAREPSVATFARLLAATGAHLQVVRPPGPVPDLVAVGAALVDVLRLAAALPVRHTDVLRSPRIPSTRR